MEVVAGMNGDGSVDSPPVWQNVRQRTLCTKLTITLQDISMLLLYSSRHPSREGLPW